MHRVVLEGSWIGSDGLGLCNGSRSNRAVGHEAPEDDLGITASFYCDPNCGKYFSILGNVGLDLVDGDVGQQFSELVWYFSSVVPHCDITMKITDNEKDGWIAARLPLGVNDHDEEEFDVGDKLLDDCVIGGQFVPSQEVSGVSSLVVGRRWFADVESMLALQVFPHPLERQCGPLYWLT